MAYINLPGTYPNLLDGNLRQFVPNNNPISLVIGSAYTGFTGELYAVNDIGAALVEYGRKSEIGKGIVEARDGGARNIFAVRLPGTAPVLSRVGSESAAAAAGDTGFTITPVLASPEAGTRYGIAYRHARNYASSGSGAANRTEVTGELIIVDLVSEELVWYGDIATGRAIEDRGLFDVTFDDVYDGSSAASAPEVITLTFTDAVAGGDIVFVIGGRTYTYTTGASETDDDIATGVAALFNDDTELSDVFTIAASTNTVTMTADGDVDVNGVLVWPEDHERAGLTVRAAIDSFSAGSSGTTLTTTVNTSHTESMDVGAFPADPLSPFALYGSGVYVPLSSVVAAYTAANTATVTATAVPVQATYSAGDNGINVSLMKKYEKLHDMFSLLDFKDFDFVLPQGVTLDAPNVGEGASAPALTFNLKGSATETELEDGLSAVTGDAYLITAIDDGQIDAGTEVEVGDIIVYDGSDWATSSLADGDIYPTRNSANDVLGKLAIVDNGDFTYTYYWDTDNDGIANISSTGDFSTLAATAGGLTYHTVNFAHQLAKFCYESSENFQFCHGVIGTSTPRSLSPRGIKEFFGKLPTYTYDTGLETSVIARAADNGTGLLGHQLVGGKYGYHFNIKNGGLPLTLDGHYDTSNSSANIATDRNGEEVDLGKYITVVAGFGKLRNEYEDRNNGYLTNIANVIAGLISSLPTNVSTTARACPAVQMDYFMPASVADEAAGARLIALINDDGVPTITDGPTFALTTSDYRRLTTMRIVSKIVEEIRLTSKPFLGRGQSTSRALAHETQLQAVIQKNINEDETITSGSFIVSQTRAQKVNGEKNISLTLTPVFELRRINLDVSLQA